VSGLSDLVVKMGEVMTALNSMAIAQSQPRSPATA